MTDPSAASATAHWAGLRFAPLLPPPVLAALAACCVAALLVAAWRRAPGWGWRAGGFAAGFAFLAGPMLAGETRRPLPDIALAVLDDTGSMHVDPARIALRDAARSAIEARARALPNLELRFATVPPRHGGTRLFAAIDRALAGIPHDRLAGIVAVTDGVAHDTPPAAAPPLPAPLHLLLPAAGEQVDRRLRLLEAPSYALVGHPATIRLVAEDLGAAPGGAATLTIRRDGEPAETRPIVVGTPETLTLPITHAGPIVAEFSVSPRPGEASTLNDRAVLGLQGVRDRLRVLLVSGEPNAGERTWRRLLKADPAVELVHFTILRPPEKDDMTPLNQMALIPFPVRQLFQEKIRDFDLIILDRFQDRALLPAAYLRNIAEYVRAGGGLLVSAGPEYAGPGGPADTPLADILPAGPGGVAEGGFRPVPTALGRRHPVLRGLDAPTVAGAAGDAWGPWYRRIRPGPVSATARPLLAGPDGAPLLMLDRVGEGRVALLLSDQIWLWARGHEGGGPAAELLRRIAHWLMKEPELEEESLSARIADNTLRVVRRSLDPAMPALRVTDPEGAVRTATLVPQPDGTAAATLPATSPGIWRVEDGTRTAFAAPTLDDPEEFADLRVTATGLAAAARASGGGAHWLAPGGAPRLLPVEPGETASGADWIGLRANHRYRVEGVEATKLLPAPVALALLLALVGMGWWREGR